MKLISFLAGALLLTLPVFAQKATLRGQVTDETGAIVLGAQVTLSEPAAGLSKTSTVDSNGSYSFSDVPLGNYTLQASAPDLALRQPAQISLKAGVQFESRIECGHSKTADRCRGRFFTHDQYGRRKQCERDGNQGSGP
ncbi:MAG: hypothetical protein DMG64_20560 [Acidobacteria bacterium]|nr:MAG: hypothetical protein DMG63_14770 [Acidobacteriota bacterium]PYX98884.1 MAG: hypothetical protein DMG64_20560 [Acidobacteriota bacterium]PYY24370.1 MAG: hypothetical protein DMG62_03520 [Acidobacteriota bacterium]